MSEAAVTLGQRAFEAYNANRGGKTHDGKDTPPWSKLTDGVREGWEAAADAASIESANHLLAELDHQPSVMIDRVIASVKAFCKDPDARAAAVMRLTQAGEYIRASSWGTPQSDREG